MADRTLPSKLSVSRESREKLALHVATLLKWQKRINLIGPSTESEVWERHIIDSLQLLPLIAPQVKVVADLGSGAGFPGLVVAIAGGYTVHLYESNGKKAAFLQEVIRLTHCDAQVHKVRLESLRLVEDLPPVQLVTARALAPLPTLLDYAEPFFRRGATAVFHKGQDIDAELTEATKYWKIKWKTHTSITDSKACLLQVEEVSRATIVR